MGFALDHVWIATRERDAALARLSVVTGLPVLDGWAPEGIVRSRGVRFAGGAFLDVHGEASGSRALVLLRGSIDAAKALAADAGWAVRVHHREDAPVERRPPWSTLMFRGGQGALSHLAIIEYAADPRGYPVEEYAGPLLWLDQAPATGPRLERVWIGGGEVDRLSCPGLASAEGNGVLRVQVAGSVGEPLRIGPVEVVFRP